MRASLQLTALLGLFAVGCIEVHTTSCAELICPGDRVCSEAHGQCVLREQVDTCLGAVEGETCSYPGVSDGRCFDGVCFSVGCGNGVVEPGEVCDDGNTRDEDGCSADCRSEETCGNGIIDVEVGERCDDGNTEDGDGCQASCLPARCGDGVVDRGEVCDDANSEDGDGCSGDCRSDESCGNGIIDVPVGERCDDGNREAGDGCQANCALPGCGDGVVDEDEACDDGNQRGGDGCNAQCTSDERCGNGVIDVALGEQCDDGGLATGDGCGATCRIEACGNGVRDPGEACDDGNLIAGDGCSATCLSLEVCGNGIVDAVAGEGCDDGNFESHDGCSSGCAAESPAWTRLALGRYTPRNGATAAYDPVRRRTIMFGGNIPGGGLEGTDLNDTWAYDGSSWRPIETAHAPEARRAAAMAYDARRRVMVLFGGVSASGGIRNDTWEFDGEDWTRRSVTTPPSRGSASPAMVYDAARGVMVLVTEDEGSTPGFETWTFDGLDWTLASNTGPQRRIEVTLAYHSRRGSAILTGGYSVFGPQRDTWEWDGTGWTELTGSTPTGYSRMAYDVERDRLVVVGGRANPGAVSVWDGTAWSELDTPNLPPARFFAPLVYDAHRRVVLTFAGDEDEARFDAVSFTDTWALDEWDWYQPASSPFDRADPGVTFDERRGRPVVTGGIPNDFFDPVFEDTWELYDGAWTRVRETLPNGPEPSRGVFMFDPESQACFMSPTLEWDGHRWIDLGLVGPDNVHEAVYDRTRGVVVAVKGRQTWERAGGAWAEVTTAVRPPSNGKMLYDRRRGRVLWLHDTVWEYDPTASPPTWNNTGLAGPPGLSGARAYSSSLGRVVVFGAGDEDTWTFDGTAWQRYALPTTPPDRGGASLVDDPMRDRVLLVAGYEADRETWQLRWESGQPDEVCQGATDEDGDGLIDCDDPDCTGHFCGDRGLQCTPAGACECPGGATETRCGDRWDDDCDGAIDCDDSDCTTTAHCLAEADCGDGTDDDGDGLTDCADPGCTGVDSCEPFEQSCADGEDNDGDGLVDCQDVDCFLTPCVAVVPPT